MPANLTLQYLKAEAEYRRAESPEEELTALQVMLRELPKHKGTDKLQADLKQRISKVKAAVAAGAGKSAKRAVFRLPRQGAGRALLIGAPNSGKSQLLKSLTRAEPEVAPYPFTTHQPIVGMMPWEDVLIQLVDTPPITADVYDPVVQGLIRSADLTLFLVDLGTDEGAEQAGEALQKIQAQKTRLGCETKLDENDIGVSWTQTLLVGNKVELEQSNERLALFHEFFDVDFDQYLISAETGVGIDLLKEAIFNALDVVRVYTKAPNKKEPDFDKPFTLKRGGTLYDVAELIHKDVAANLKSARVWGSDVHPGTTVKADYVISDKDVVEIHSS